MATLTKKNKARLYVEIAHALLDVTDPKLFSLGNAKAALKIAYAGLK